KKTLLKFVDEVARPEYAEQRPDAPLITELNARDRKLDGIRYFTFGGSVPTLVRLYAWIYTKESAVPHRNGLRIFFRRRAEPQEISLVSPLPDRVPGRPRFPELTPGEGDVLVSDASARLPWAQHRTVPLNHRDVLANEALQREV